MATGFRIPNRKIVGPILVAGSRLFEPTHHVFVRLFDALQDRVEFRIYAKHPNSPSKDRPAPAYLRLPASPPWVPSPFKLVHAIGGGQTAIKIARVLDPRFPLVVSFVGAVDLTRQLGCTELAGGYRELFARATFVSCPGPREAILLINHGVPRQKIRFISPCLPLERYPLGSPGPTRKVIMAGRPIARKNQGRAVLVARESRFLDSLVLIGTPYPALQDGGRIQYRPIMPYTDFLEELRTAWVLLQSGDWVGDEVDSLPVVVLEALAMGVPVVSTPLIGVVDLQYDFPDMIHIGSDIQGLARLLDVILGSPAPRIYSEAAEQVCSRFSLRRTVDDIVAIYEAALQCI